MSNLVDIGGRRLEVDWSGTSQPTVVFECGAGRTFDDWDEVRSLIDPGLSIFAYSRAGQGHSDRPDLANLIFDDGEVQVATAESRIEDLERALSMVGALPPYVLVGHSLGGIYIRLFAERHPGDVSALIFVDSSHPNQIERMADAVHNSNLSCETKTEFLSRRASPNAPVIRTASKTGPFRDMPIVILSRDPDRIPDTDGTEMPPEFHSLVEQVWAELQSELEVLSSNFSRIVVKDAGHLLHRDAPAVVAQAVSRVAGMVRSSY